MLMNFFRKSIARIQGKGLSSQEMAGTGKVKKTRDSRGKLINSAPLSLSESYKRPLDQPELDGVFLRMRRNMLKSLDEIEQNSGETKAVRESGTLMTGKPYFYIKPFNQNGWLFERTESGWVICKAEKIYGQDSFIRSDRAWDIASVLSSADGRSTPRVNSSRFDLNLVSLSLYEDQVKGEVLGDLI